MKKKVYVTRQIPQKAIDMLAEKYEVEVNPDDRVLTKAEVVEKVKGRDGLLCLLTDAIDGEVMDSEPNLKMIANYAVGFNNIDLPAATERGIMVSNTPGVLSDTTADFAFTLLMAVARRVVEADKFLRAGKFHGWGPMMMLGQDVYERTLGIVGMGRIGLAMAKKGIGGFDMKVLYYDIQRNEEADKMGAVFCENADEVFSQADFVSVHLPLNDETKHFVGERELGLMKSTACLINTARGPIVDEGALVKVLEEKKIFGAALDVFEEEPKVHPGLLELDNAVLVPHIASASIETRTKMGVIAAENMIAGLEGQKPPTLLNPETYKG